MWIVDLLREIIGRVPMIAHSVSDAGMTALNALLKTVQYPEARCVQLAIESANYRSITKSLLQFTASAAASTTSVSAMLTLFNNK